MSFDLLGHAQRHRYRVRNLHDGRPVPPVRQKRTPGRRAAFGGAGDRLGVIACRHGYVVAEGEGIGWVLLCRSKRSFTPRLEAIGAVTGVMVAQAGDSEAAGDAPATAVEELLSVLGAYRRRPPSQGRSAEAMRALGQQRRLAGAP